MTRGVIAGLLEARGYEVDAFTDAGQALQVIRADPEIGALITSSETTPISAVELCWEARLLAGRQRPIYILLMSSSDDKRTRCEALDGGADDVIDVPPIPEELYAKLRVAERVVSLQRELVQLATTDPLTGVCNRRAFFEAANEACLQPNQRHSLSAILFDIDRFKAINDRYGHDVGDEAVRAVAAVAQCDDAIVGRLGGDEFGILLKERVLSDAVQIAEGLRRRFAELSLPTVEGAVSLTCSLGVGQLQPGDSVDDLMKRADLALYRAKDEGRNRVATPPSNSWMGQRPRQAVSLVRSLARQTQAERMGERRNGLPPSDALLARICAVMDVLITSGLSAEGAAQVMTRRTLAAGVLAPKKGTEATDWKRLLAWRNGLLDGDVTVDVVMEYQSLAALIELIPPHERVERVLDDELWNRRRSRM
jgi:two-component system cell cycle response regulator